MTEIERLDKEISEQKEENIKLYSVFQYRLHEEEMQPVIKKWREGSKKLKELISQENQLLTKEKEPKQIENRQTFVNGYGEATTREITSLTYKRAEKRLSRQIMSFIG